MSTGKRGQMKRGRARERARRKSGYLHTVRMVRDTLHSVEPPPRLIIEIRNLGQAFGTDDLVMDLARTSRKKRRGLIIGGVCSTLSIFGMASYALAKHYMQRQGIEVDQGLITPA